MGSVRPAANISALNAGASASLTTRFRSTALLAKRPVKRQPLNRIIFRIAQELSLAV